MKKLTVIECNYCYAAWDVRVEDGKEIFRSSIRKYQNPRAVDLYHESSVYQLAGLPVEIVDVNYPSGCADPPYKALTRQFSDLVCSGVENGNPVLVAGGYCNYAPAVAGGIQRALGRDASIGLVWIDAHSDNCIAEDSDTPTRLVGVPLSVMTGSTLENYRKTVCGLENPLKGENIVAGDIRFATETNAAHLEREHVVRLDATAFQDEGIWKKEIDSLARRVDVIYLSVDADILKADYIPAYEKKVPYGHDIDTVLRNIRIVMETKKVCAYSLFCVDFDHYERGGPETYLNGMQLIAAGLRGWR
ncbi:MAG TPA: arginase family protein [Candidatus Eisenbergiella merdigallinarum]|uniref:Arginase family protein n=1 Tax=Candidatus Eisenbergiella merdigallinarum TaxID=2838552 RepID=A0A9D2MP69_9FIRM|nr:arginase family protein [Candidatus Eisenbergiella merdigallinarum]